MTALPLGVGAYTRLQANAPQIKLINRFFEKAPWNLREGATLLSRPGTSILGTFLAGGGSGGIRKLTSQVGMFSNDLFVVSGNAIYRYGAIGSPYEGAVQAITGTINGTGIPHVGYTFGIGYSYLWISDGTLLQYYSGGTQATGTLTWNGTGPVLSSSPDPDLVNIGPTWYGWNTSVDHASPNGTLAQPWLCPPGTDPLEAMANMLSFNGTPGADFSTALSGPNAQVTVVAADGSPPALTMATTAVSDGAFGNTIATTVGGSSANVSWGNTTLLGGGVHALHGVDMPNGDPPGAVCQLDQYLMVAKAGSNKFYWIGPGDTTMDALQFMTKESAPDQITDMITCGDVFLVFGSESQECWTANTGSDAALNPFAPLEGRNIARGAVAGTVVLVADSVLYVGSDGIVYKALGSTSGAGSYGVTQIQRISDHGIEERIRMQLRTEAGLSP